MIFLGGMRRWKRGVGRAVSRSGEKSLRVEMLWRLGCWYGHYRKETIVGIFTEKKPIMLLFNTYYSLSHLYTATTSF